jgi:hypothetical protein
MGIEFFYRHIVTLLLKVNTTLGYRRDNKISTSSRIDIFLPIFVTNNTHANESISF